jgi:hypothetical protein
MERREQVLTLLFLTLPNVLIFTVSVAFYMWTEEDDDDDDC